MVTQVCGFKDSKGTFHETKEQALIADLAHKVWFKHYVVGKGPFKQDVIDLITSVFLDKENKNTIIEILNVRASDL